MIDGSHQKSFNNTISAFSATTQANVPVAGLLKALFNFFNGEIMKVLQAFAVYSGAKTVQRDLVLGQKDMRRMNPLPLALFSTCAVIHFS